MTKIAILGYHNINPETSLFDTRKERYIYTIDQENFRQQLTYLYRNSYHGILIDGYIKHITQNLQNSELDKSIILTFDDGHVSNYTHAFPLLREYNYVATFFVTVNNIGTPEAMTWKQLKEMEESGMSIQSHTMSHPLLNDVSPQKIYQELYESKLILEQNLGHAVNYLALPGGRYNSTVKQIAMDVGYHAVCTSVVGYNNADTDPYSLKRWIIRRDTKFSTFAGIIYGRYSTFAYHRTRYFLLAGIKRALGNRIYKFVHKEFTSKLIKGNSK